MKASLALAFALLALPSLALHCDCGDIIDDGHAAIGPVSLSGGEQKIRSEAAMDELEELYSENGLNIAHFPFIKFDSQKKGMWRSKWRHSALQEMVCVKILIRGVW